MLQYVWIIILAGLWLAWTIRAVVDGIQWFIHRNDCGFIYDEYGCWALVWIIAHLVVLFIYSLGQYGMAHGWGS
jgi:hypothetical protein